MASNYNHVPAPAGGRRARRGDRACSCAARPRTTSSRSTSADRRPPSADPRSERRRDAPLSWGRSRPDPTGGRPVPSPVPAHPPLRVAVLGCGVVGTEVVRLLTDAGRRPGRARGCAASSSSGSPCATSTPTRDPVVDRALLTTDAEALVERADVVVEVMGGIEPARTLLLRAIAGGASVVTANKALLGPGRPHALRRGRRGRASTCTSRPPSPVRSRSSARCASRSPATA